jgi:hypothetical protein
MCKAKNEGGTRCAHHARLDLESARKQFDANPTLDNHYEVIAATDAYAATPSGATDLQEQIEAATQCEDTETAETLQASMDRGAALRERNQAVASAVAPAARRKTMSGLGEPDLGEPGFEDARGQYETIREQLSNLPEADGQKVRAAMDTAWQLHRGQVRASTTIPYITHPLSNLQTLLDYGITDPDVLAAAALHDCVEDCASVYTKHAGVSTTDEDMQRDITQRAINSTFGSETGAIVAAVSNPLGSAPGATPEEKNRAYVAHATEQIRAHFGAFMVKYSDFIDNAGTLKAAQFDNPARKMKLARKYEPLAKAFEEALGEHERLGVSTLDAQARVRVLRELGRVQDDLGGILDAGS